MDRSHGLPSKAACDKFFFFFFSSGLLEHHSSTGQNANALKFLLRCHLQEAQHTSKKLSGLSCPFMIAESNDQETRTAPIHDTLSGDPVMIIILTILVFFLFVVVVLTKASQITFSAITVFIMTGIVI